MQSVFPAKMITEKQFNFIRDLIEARDWVDAVSVTESITIKRLARVEQWNPDNPPDIPIKDASRAIDELLKCSTLMSVQTKNVTQSKSKWVQLKDSLIDVPDARYALQSSDGHWVFFRVVRRKNGAVYVNRLVGAPGDWQVLFMPIDQMLSVAKRVAADPKTAAIAYAQQHGRCSVCESPLSDPKSIELSMGPVCAKKFN